MLIPHCSEEESSTGNFVVHSPRCHGSELLVRWVNVPGWGLGMAVRLVIEDCDFGCSSK